MSSFRMFRARGQPGHYYGYAEIDGITYKIDAVTIGKNLGKHWIGTIKRHLKADQQKLPLGTMAAGGFASSAARPTPQPSDAPDLDDEIPF